MTEPRPKRPSKSAQNLPLPGMAVISLWMLVLAIIGVVGALTGRFPAGATRIAVLALCTGFALAGWGLMRRRRWGWAMTLGAVFFSMSFGFYNFFRFRQGQWMFMALVNLVFFLYLARSEVIGRLR